MVDHHDIYALDAAALHRLRGDVANLSDAELGLPTRCDGWTVEDLIQHMNAEHEAILNLFSDPLALPCDVRTAFDTTAGRWIEAFAPDKNSPATVFVPCVLLYEDTALCDVETGEIVDEEAVDWDNTEDQPDAEPAEGLRHAKTVTETTVFAPEYYCLDYRAAGLTPEEWFARRAGLVDTETGEAVDLDDEAREAAHQQAEADRAEAEKRERRKVVALNRVGDAALSVRRDFVKKLLARLVDCTNAIPS